MNMTTIPVNIEDMMPGCWESSTWVSAVVNSSSGRAGVLANQRSVL